MENGLYHMDLGLPKGFVKPVDRVRLMWSGHADRARVNDRYGILPRVETLPLSVFDVIEVEVTDGRVNKYVVRGHFTKDLDACFVIVPLTRTSVVVKTVWFNERNDLHKTLDKSKYVH